MSVSLQPFSDGLNTRSADCSERHLKNDGGGVLTPGVARAGKPADVRRQRCGPWRSRSHRSFPNAQHDIDAAAADDEAGVAGAGADAAAAGAGEISESRH